jgi:hypothetical protein
VPGGVNDIDLDVFIYNADIFRENYISFAFRSLPRSISDFLVVPEYFACQ